MCLWLLCHASAAPAAVDPARLSLIDALIEQAMRDGRLPGAVVLVGHEGDIVYERAFGARSLAAETPEPMTADTVFDLASLTKVVATCLLYTSPSPRDGLLSRMPSSA